MKRVLLYAMAVLAPSAMLWAPVVLATRLGRTTAAMGVAYYAFWWMLILTPLPVLASVILRRPLHLLALSVAIALPVTGWEMYMVIVSPE